MTLENVFYTLGIIFMVLSVTCLVGLVVLGYILKRKIDNLQKNVQDKVEILTAVVKHPKEVALGFGEVIAGTVIKKFQELFTKPENPR